MSMFTSASVSGSRKEEGQDGEEGEEEEGAGVSWTSNLLGMPRTSCRAAALTREEVLPAPRGFLRFFFSLLQRMSEA